MRLIIQQNIVNDIYKVREKDHLKLLKLYAMTFDDPG